MNNDLCLDARDSHLAQCKSVENDAVFGLAVADLCKHVFLSPENVAGGTIANLRPVQAPARVAVKGSVIDHHPNQAYLVPRWHHP